jgi:hypothetical protein
MAGRKNFYAEINGTDSGAHHVDDDVDRRAGNEALRRRIVALQDLIVAALGDERDLYLALEDLVNQRIDEREEAYFNAGFEHGFIEGRRKTLAAARSLMGKPRLDPRR